MPIKYKAYHLEGDEIPPNPRSVRGLDVLVQVVQNDVIDVLVPSQDLSNLRNLALTDLYPGQGLNIESLI